MIRLSDVGATEAFGRHLAGVIAPGDVIALSGPLGAGKTALTRGILSGLGFVGDVPSPTFGLVIPYDPPATRLSVWHVDLYRIDDPAELDELGLDDARAQAALVIEWPERMGAGLWSDALCLTIAIEGEGRSLTATVPPSWTQRWPLR